MGPVQAAASAFSRPEPAKLPSAPPSAGRRRSRINMFDDEHRQETLLAIGMGMLSGGNDFGASMANTARNLSELRSSFRAEQTPRTEIGGPENSFEITTDPMTGQRSYREIPEFREAREAQQERSRAPSAADRITMRGQVMSSILRAPPEQRQALYARMLADGDRLFGGVDLGLPATWDEAQAGVFADQAIRPETRMTDAYRRDVLEHRVENDGRNFQLRSANTNSTIAARDARSSGAIQGRSAPPSTRRGRRSSRNADLEYLR